MDLRIPKVISREMPVFYNPVMKRNRDIAIEVIRSLERKNLFAIDALAGSGIRSIRFLKELPKDTFSRLCVNDADERAYYAILENIKTNKLSAAKKSGTLIVTNADASTVIRKRSWDYIEIDPFGSPNPFLDAAVSSLRVHGLLALTATDTAPLAGSAAKACSRKYWAVSKNNRLKHEWGLRILIRKAQLIAAQYERALVPVLSYWDLHYYRVYLTFVPGKTRVDDVLFKHRMAGGKGEEVGPLWTGQLSDSHFAKKVLHNAKQVKSDVQVIRLLEKVSQESAVTAVGFVDLHQLARKKAWTNVPSITQVLDVIKKHGYEGVQTHLTQAGVRTTMPQDLLGKAVEHDLYRTKRPQKKN